MSDNCSGLKPTSSLCWHDGEPLRQTYISTIPPYKCALHSPLHADRLCMVQIKKKNSSASSLRVFLLPVSARKLEDKSTEPSARAQIHPACKVAMRMCACAYVCIRVLTYEARWGRIRLDILPSVALNHVPESPHVAGVKDVEGLVRMDLAVLHVRTEQVVVRTGIPLKVKHLSLDSREVEFHFSFLMSVVLAKHPISQFKMKTKLPTWRAKFSFRLTFNRQRLNANKMALATGRLWSPLSTLSKIPHN